MTFLWLKMNTENKLKTGVSVRVTKEENESQTKITVCTTTISWSNSLHEMEWTAKEINADYYSYNTYYTHKCQKKVHATKPPIHDTCMKCIAHPPVCTKHP